MIFPFKALEAQAAPRASSIKRLEHTYPAHHYRQNTAI